MGLKLTNTGNIIKEYLDEFNISQKELSKRTGYSEKHISNVLNSNARLTEEFALKLEKIINNVPASYWLNYEARYREQLARDKEKYELSQCDLTALAKQYHFKEVFNGLDLSIQEQAIEMLKILKISSFSQFDKTYHHLNYDFMKDGGEKEAIVIWLKLCEEEIDIQNSFHTKYKKTNLLKNLDKFKTIAINEDIHQSITECRNLCNEIGINLVIVEAICNCKVRGALTTYKGNPAIYLSGRFKTHDHIWFAFMHEIGHLLNDYDSKETLISIENYDSEKEKSANTFAGNYFINVNCYQTFIKSKEFDNNNILQFAKTQNVLPGIVVSRLQHDQLIGFNQYNHLKIRFE